MAAAVIYSSTTRAESTGDRSTTPRDRKEDTLSHGVYPDVTLAEFRDKLEAAKKLIKAGIDPKARDREAAAAATVKADLPRPAIPKADPFSRACDGFYERATARGRRRIAATCAGCSISI